MFYFKDKVLIPSEKNIDELKKIFYIQDNIDNSLYHLNYCILHDTLFNGKYHYIIMN